MARDEAPPWPRGSTYYNVYGQFGLIDPQNLGGWQHMGKEWRHEDVTYGTNQYVTIRAVRNTGTFPLLGGRLCALDPAYPLNAINGYTDAQYQPGVMLDEFLPPAGLPPGDLGWAIVEGPCAGLTALDGGADNVINWFDPLGALTATSSGAAGAGRLQTVSSGALTGGGQAVPLNVIGRALSGMTTANTNAKVLCNVVRLF